MTKVIDKDALAKDDVVLYEYAGAVDKQVVLGTLPEIETILDTIGVPKQKKRRVVNIAIETLQNLQLHSYQAKGDPYQIQPHFLVAKNNGFLSITIGNLIAVDEKELLEDKLRKINSLNDEEIKFLYGVIMKQTVVKFSTKGGAGLGLIDMKKKSGNALDYCFQDVDGKVCYFCLKINVAE